MIENWGYLITNNRAYWNSQIYHLSNAIRCKFANLPNPNYRQFFPPAEHENGFRIFGFIDNTIIAMSRVGSVLGEGEVNKTVI